MSEDVTLEKVANLAKRRGFIFPGSEIYGGLANSWDYGPLGVLLKNNLRDAWWRRFVVHRRDMVGLDAAILMNPKVWEASGHVDNFNDPLVEDTVTHKRYRADHLLEETLGHGVEEMSLEDMQKALEEHGVKSPDGNPLTAPKRFNLLFETHLGTTEDRKQSVYLRGELAQAMFVDFKRIVESQRLHVPFGIAEYLTHCRNSKRLHVPFGIAAVGKVFRNEITPGNFTFRTLEFDLMEFEYFVHEENVEKTFEYWLAEMQRWASEEVGLSRERMRVREHTSEELSHYSTKTVDVEYETPFGWKELFGLAYRTDYDLKNHAEKTGHDLSLTDPETNEKFYPHTVEPTFGLTRLMLMVMLEAYCEEEVKGEKRVVMKLKPDLAPYQVAVLPLSKKDELMKVAEPLADQLVDRFSCDYDVTQSIGKRYRRHDEIGTPFCVTVDFDSLEDKAVTIRERDSMEQERVKIDKVVEVLSEKLGSARG